MKPKLNPTYEADNPIIRSVPARTKQLALWNSMTAVHPTDLPRLYVEIETQFPLGSELYYFSRLGLHIFMARNSPAAPQGISSRKRKVSQIGPSVRSRTPQACLSW